MYKKDYLIYRILLEDKLSKHCVSCENPCIGITHHFEGEEENVVIINYSNNFCNLDLRVHEDYEICNVLKENIKSIEPFSTTILRVAKKN